MKHALLATVAPTRVFGTSSPDAAARSSTQQRTCQPWKLAAAPRAAGQDSTSQGQGTTLVSVQFGLHLPTQVRMAMEAANHGCTSHTFWPIVSPARRISPKRLIARVPTAGKAGKHKSNQKRGCFVPSSKRSLSLTLFIPLPSLPTSVPNLHPPPDTQCAVSSHHKPQEPSRPSFRSFPSSQPCISSSIFASPLVVYFIQHLLPRSPSVRTFRRPPVSPCVKAHSSSRSLRSLWLLPRTSPWTPPLSTLRSEVGPSRIHATAPRSQRWLAC